MACSAALLLWKKAIIEVNDGSILTPAYAKVPIKAARSSGLKINIDSAAVAKLSIKQNSTTYFKPCEIDPRIVEDIFFLSKTSLIVRFIFFESSSEELINPFLENLIISS